MFLTKKKKKIAIKIVEYKNFQKKKKKKMLKKEIEILKQLDHQNIVKLYDVHEENEICYMVFEYISGGELFDFIVKQGRLSEIDARKFMRQIVSAIEYCHSLLVVHRDLKPENLLLDDEGNIKISDFGLSNIIVPGKRFSTFCGSLHYASPEILSGEKYVGPGIDIWSLGIILYCLVVGRQPWDGRTAEEIINAIANQGLSIPTNISDDCVDLIVSMLRVKEEQRIPISDIRKHPWMNKGYENEPVPSFIKEPFVVDKVDQEILRKLKKNRI